VSFCSGAGRHTEVNSPALRPFSDGVTEAPQAQEKNVAKETAVPKHSAPALKAKDYEALLAAKDETISVLKGTVKDLKKSNKQITTTLRGEIDLLKEAFHEMRTLYMHQIEYQDTERHGKPVMHVSGRSMESLRLIFLKTMTIS